MHKTKTGYIRLAGIFFLFLIMMVFQSCSSTRLVDSWQSDDGQPEALKRVLVLGVFKEEFKRRIYEDSLVSALESQGAAGVAGYTLMPDPKDYDEKEEIRAAVKKSGADGVMITTFKGKKKQERTIPPSVEYLSGPRHRLYDYYGASYRTVYHPGYTVTDTIVLLETAVFSVSTEKMVWAGATESVNPSSGEKISDEAGKILTKEMKKKGLL